jgi:hypothetical protein
MRSIARVRWRKNAEHLPRVEQEAWRRENEQEREAEKQRQGQSEQAFKQSQSSRSLTGCGHG